MVRFVFMGIEMNAQISCLYLCIKLESWIALVGGYKVHVLCSSMAIVGSTHSTHVHRIFTFDK